MLRKALVTLGMCALMVGGLLVGGRMARADGMEFDYKDPKEISAVSLTMDSMLEPIVGYAKGISGTVVFDPAHPKATTGRITVDVASIQFANEGYTATARGYALNGEQYPQILFTLKKVLRVTRASVTLYNAVVQADFTCHGVTTPLTLPVAASYFPGMALERTDGKYKGDVLVIRTHFNVSRKRQGITRGIPGKMVGDTVEVRVAVVGLHYAPGQQRPGEAPPIAPTDARKQTGAADNRAGSRWKLEVELRDDAINVAADFDLKAQPPRASFTTATGTLVADAVQLSGNRLTFHLPANPQLGEVQGEAVFTQDALQGMLTGKTKTVRIHGRPEYASDALRKGVGNGVQQGPGFRDLKIALAGKTWTLAERMAFHHVPAVSIARIRDFRVVEKGAFGVTNVETSETVDANTLFHAGSMGSPLVDLLALRLAALGRLDLNRPANAYLRDARIQENALTRHRPITVLDLVNDTSGLTQYKFMGYRLGTKPPTLVELLQGADRNEMEPLDVKSEPGTFHEAGINGAVLEQVIANATGRPLPDLMQELIFTPFGMKHSTYEPFLRSNAARKVALGHYSTGELMLDRVHIYPEKGETGLWTTAADFAQALCQIQLLLAGKPNRILAEGQRSLLKSVVTPSRVLGLIKSDPDDFLHEGYFYHGGDPYGYFANHATHQQNGTGVVVMANRMLSWQLNNEIVRAVELEPRRAN